MRRVVAGTGRVLVTVGLLIVLFVVYQLWGTGWFAARDQRDLERELAAFAAEVPGTTGTAASSAPTTTPRPGSSSTTARDRSTTSGTTDPVRPTSTTRPATTSTSTPTNLPLIEEGDPIGYIRIPRIGVDWVFVQGTDTDDLKRGPGHYATTVLPGQIGNAAIAGHRTTYGAPFNRLDELAVGDDIIIEMPYIGTFVYRIFERVDGPNPFAVAPTQVEVADQETALRDGVAMLTLTTCHPEYSARERLVAQARLVVERSAPAITRESQLPVRVAAPATTIEPTDGLAAGEEGAVVDVDDPFAGDPSARLPAALWAVATAMVGLLWWWAYRRYRHPLTWVAGLVPFLVPLLGCYVYLERALPAGY